MTDEPLPDNSAEENENNPQPETHHHRRRRRVRKRIRIKKKASPKKKLRKWGERLLWLIIIIGFITTLVIMVQQLNIVDEKNKKGKSYKINSDKVAELKYS